MRLPKILVLTAGGAEGQRVRARRRDGERDRPAAVAAGRGLGALRSAVQAEADHRVCLEDAK